MERPTFVFWGGRESRESTDDEDLGDGEGKEGAREGGERISGVLFTARPVVGLQLPVSDNQAGIRYTNTQYPFTTRWITAFLSDPGKRNTPAAAYQPSQETHTHTHTALVSFTRLFNVKLATIAAFQAASAA